MDTAPQKPISPSEATDPLGAPGEAAESQDLVFLIDCDGRFRFANQPVCALLDTPLERILGATIPEIDRAAAILSRCDVERIQVCQSGQEICGTLSDPTLSHPAHYEYSLQPIHDARNQVDAVIFIGRHTGERTRAAAEKRRLLKQVRESARQQRTFYRDVLASVTQGKLWLCSDPEELPLKLPQLVEPIVVRGSEHLSDVRQRVIEACLANDFSRDRAQALATAVSEAAMNALVHAGGGVATVYGVDGNIHIWIEDNGEGISMEALPRATLERGYSTAASLGHGFWLMLHMADRLYLMTGPTGTTVVIEQHRLEPDLVWS